MSTATESNGKRPGAPTGNQNAARHYLALRRSGLPGKCRNISKALRAFRAQVEEELIADRGEVSLHDAALVQSAERHERRALLLEREITRLLGTTYTSGELEKLLSSLTHATDSRDRTLGKLGLKTTPRPGVIDLSALYRTPQDQSSAQLIDADAEDTQVQS